MTTRLAPDLADAPLLDERLGTLVVAVVAVVVWALRRLAGREEER